MISSFDSADMSDDSWEVTVDETAGHFAEIKEVLSELAQGILVAHARIDEMETRLAAGCRAAAASGAKEASDAGLVAAKHAFGVAETTLTSTSRSVSNLETLCRQATAGLQKAATVAEGMEPRITASVTAPISALRQHTEQANERYAKEAAALLQRTAHSLSQEIEAAKRSIDVRQTASKAAQDLAQLTSLMHTHEQAETAANTQIAAKIRAMETRLQQAVDEASAGTDQKAAALIRQAVSTLARRQRNMAILLSLTVAVATAACTFYKLMDTAIIGIGMMLFLVVWTTILVVALGDPKDEVKEA